MNTQSWIGEADAHSRFQLDLSCLLDGELDEARAARAILHIEECPACREFLKDLRLQVRLHREATDPDRLFARVAMLSRGDSFSFTDGLISESLEAEAEAIDLVHRLATVFYQLGKSYVLAAIDPDFRTRVFEAAAPISETKNAGRGFVDGVLTQGTDRGGVDWQRARHLLNGRLERIESPFEKGRRLLEEAIEADPSHEEARLYRAFMYAHVGRTLDAAEEYRDVFNTAVNETNRGHAAMQLGKLYIGQRSYRKSIVCFRWLTISGLVDVDDRFFGARFNLGKSYSMLGDKDRALEAFETLLTRHPGRLNEVRELFANAPLLQAAIDSVPGFAEELLERCSSLFSGDTDSAGQRLQEQ